MALCLTPVITANGFSHVQATLYFNLELMFAAVPQFSCPGGGGTPLFGLYGYVPLDRVWFFGLAVLNRVYNLTCLCPKQVKTCPKQGMVL